MIIHNFCVVLHFGFPISDFFIPPYWGPFALSILGQKIEKKVVWEGEGEEDFQKKNFPLVCGSQLNFTTDKVLS